MTPYVDGEVSPETRRSADSHVAACPECRDHVLAERAGRDVIQAHRQQLRGIAPTSLRRRCAAHALPGRPLVMRRWLPLSLAASLLLAVGAVFLFGLNQSVEALAAGLTLDHVSCFKETPPSTIDPHVASTAWQQSQGWSLTVPETAPAEELRLVDVRRCLSTEGRVAHLLYMWRGEPLSVYVLPRSLGRARTMDSMGHETAIWSAHGRTYAVLATGHPQDFDRIVGYVKTHAE
jgi:anti-sigma factor RsiW